LACFSRFRFSFSVGYPFYRSPCWCFFGQLLKLSVERNTWVVWFEFRGVCGYVAIFVNCNWVDTRWQLHSIHLHKTIHRTTQLIWEEIWTVPRLCQLCPGICLTTEENARRNLSQGTRKVQIWTMKTKIQNIHKNKNT
jgi:hypothetical protein